MKKSIDLHPGMGTAIVNHLRQFSDLPADGILAGQAVDSAITDLFGCGGGVYNDIDVFQREANPFQNVNHRRANSLTNRFEISSSVGDETYSGMGVLLEVVQTYGIHAVKREGMLNTVSCSLTDPVKTLSAQRVIRGFDVNCTRVAVDLATNVLVWDREYADFVHSRQLRISMMHTPWHTFLRLAKKAEELPGVYVDLDVAAEACVAIANSSWLHRMMQRKGVSLQFGKKHQALAERFESVWAPYFRMETKRLYRGQGHTWTADEAKARPDAKFVDLCSLMPRGGLDAKLQDRCNRMGNGLLFFAPRVVESSRRKVAPAAYHKLNAIVGLAPAKPWVSPNGRNEPPPLSTLGIREMDFVQVHAELFGADYVQGQALPALATKVTDWVRQHQGLGPALVGLTLSEQYARMQAITEVCRKFGKQYFEGDTKAGLGILEVQRDAAIFESTEAMEQALLQYYRANSTPFDIAPLDLPATSTLPARFEGFTVKELLTPHALKYEGTHMGHCVGGYSDAVRRGRSRILAIRYRDERRTENCSTVELQGSFDKPGALLRIVQNYSYSNTTPSAKNREFVHYLQQYLHRVAHIVKGCKQPGDGETERRLLQAAHKYEFQARHSEFLLRQLQAQVTRMRDSWHLGRNEAPPAEIREKLSAHESVLAEARAVAPMLRELALTRMSANPVPWLLRIRGQKYAVSDVAVEDTRMAA
jgi:hypothetical protein